MKRFLALSLLLASFLTASADDKPIGFNELPATAQTFIKTHFSNARMSHATVDAEIGDTDYEVLLDNGTKLEFNGSGEWREVANKTSQVPSSIVPKGISAYVSQNYPDARIVKLERNTFRYDVTLSNHIELEFDLNSKFLGIDD
ncbi:MAG: PepSY-like domain-containing protein [Alistipes sp.]|nr:PepSY-like domain-containing protein [Alistipes sp.]